ncbi:MAG: Holliday junction branch migration protein RuvA [Eubacterium sp.]|nr:Holliday junction branch migration protein RuvA [Eubacterium sp.]
MIAYIKGILDTVEQDRIVVENQGMGYEILVPGSVLSQLPSVGREVKIYTYLHVREDIMQLFGFLSRDELNMFKMLITVNGVGPKGALGVLTVMDADQLRFAILADDAKSIAKAPGIGAKTAGKVILELKDKCDLEEVFESSFAKNGQGTAGQTAMSSASQDAIEALVALGYSAAEAAKAVGRCDYDENTTVEEILKQSLKNMG